MRFYGITMEGRFVNHTLDTVPSFNTDTDPGRLIYTIDDGKLWWGDGYSAPPRWRSISDYVDVGNNEAEDMYSDLLRTTVFLNCTWDNFDENETNNAFMNDSPTEGSSIMTYDDALKVYEYDSSNNILESLNLKDAVVTAVPEIRHCMPSVWWINTSGNDVPQIYVTANGGTNWEGVTNNDFHEFDYPGNDLRMRVVLTGATTGFIRSWGLLYNKDLSVSCARQALSTYEEVILLGVTTIYTPYTVGAVLVYMNGILLQDEQDYTATDGSSIDIHSPAPQVDDVITVISYSTLVTTAGPVDHTPYLRRDGTTDWLGPYNQSMTDGATNYKFTDLSDGTNGTTDSVNMSQIYESTNDNMKHYRLFKNEPPNFNNQGVSCSPTWNYLYQQTSMENNHIYNLVTTAGRSSSSLEAVNRSWVYANYTDILHPDLISSSSDYGHARIWTDGNGTLRIQVV